MENLPARQRRDREADHAQGEDVLVALARAEDEEAVLDVVRDQRDEHHADDAGRRERREQTEDEHEPRAELGEARKPHVQDPGLHAQALEPPGRAFDLAAAEDVVVAVGHHHDPHHDPKYQQPRADALIVHRLPRSRSGAAHDTASSIRS